MPSTEATDSAACTTYTDLMSDPASFADLNIFIYYQEDAKVETTTTFNDLAERPIPSVVKDIFSVDFPQDSEFWIESIQIYSEEEVFVDFSMTTAQLCTDQYTGQSTPITRYFEKYLSLGAGEYLDLDISNTKATSKMTCLSNIKMVTRRSYPIVDAQTYNIGILILGAKIYPGTSDFYKCDCVLLLSMVSF